MTDVKEHQPQPVELEWPSVKYATPERLKSDMETLIVQALSNDQDERMQERVFRLVSDRANQLRTQYGLPEVAPTSAELRVLRTPTEQLHAASVGHYSFFPQAVYARATNTKKSQESDQCLFDECFQDDKLAKQYRKEALEQANAKLDPSVKHVTVYPPLLMRALTNEQITLHLNVKRKCVQKPRGGPSTPANVMFVFFEQGPIIPVVERSLHKPFKKIVDTLYRLQGATNAEAVQRAVLQCSLA